MKKRGQATIFIIIGIVIVAIILVVIFLSTRGEPEPEKIITPLQQIEAETTAKIESCLAEKAKLSVITLGLQGGYILLPEDYVETNFSEIAYIYDSGEILLPTLEEMETDISEQLEVAVPFCLGFDQEANINQTSPTEAITKITEDKIDITFTMPLEITLDDTTTITLNRAYTYSLDVRLGYIHNSILSVLEMEKKYQMIDFYILDNLDLTTKVFREENTLVYMFQDQKSNIDGTPYSFLFANKFGSSPSEFNETIVEETNLTELE